MKIAIESSTIGSKVTGTNRYLNCLLEQLGVMGNEILYFRPASKEKVFMPDSIKRHLYRQFLLKDEIERTDCDFGIFPDYFMPHKFNKPAAVVIHDLSFISHPQFYSNKFVKYYNYQLKKTLEQNPVLITVSQYTKNNIIKYLGITENNIYIVQGYSKMKPNNIVVNHKSQNIIPCFLYVGHIEPRKNIKFLVDGFREWKKGLGISLKLKIVGEFWIKSTELIRLISDCQNDPDIEFTGYVSTEELYNIYNHASGFVHTSFEEGFGFPILEAMEFNLPIICTKDIASEEISAPLSIPIDPNNKKSFYNGLDKMLALVLKNERPEYHIKYSPSLMREQLLFVLEMMESRMKKRMTVNIPRVITNENALEKTLVYSGMFNSGVKKDKIHEQLFDKKINRSDLERIIENYKALNLITESEGYLYLNNKVKGFYDKSDIRINKGKTEKLLRFLNRLPFVSLIAFSGGTAIYGLFNHDDIDLFIITKPHSVFIVYFIIHLYSLLFNSRKELCANFLIDETNFLIKHSQDQYTAHQIINLVAFRNKRMLDYFISRNSWIKSFFPNYDIINDENKAAGRRYYFLRPINLAIMTIYKIMYRKKLSEYGLKGSMIISEKCLKLHSNDNRFRIIDQFQKTWNEYLEGKRGKHKPVKQLVLK